MNLHDRNLSKGMTGDDVKFLQSELRQLGYAIADGEVAQSLFGETTLRAVVDFQKSRGLTDDGIVGANTAKELSVAIAGLTDPNHGTPTKSEPKKSEPKESAPPPSDSSTKLPPKGDPKLPTNTPPISYVIQGQIRQTDEKPAVGLIVRAFDKDASGSENKIGESVSDQDGMYKITYPEALFSKLSGGRNQLDMVLRVFDQTHNMNQGWNVVQITKPVEILEMRKVSWLPWKEPETTPFSVSGRVLWFDDRPAANVTVRAFDKDMRSEEELGQAITDDQGHYQINYSASQFRRNEKGRADLIVRVSDGAGTLPVSSPIIFNAKPLETVDLRFGLESRGLSEYESMIKELTPLLQDVPVSELVENDDHKDISFLAGETGFDPQHITWLVQAAAWEKQSMEIDPTLHTQELIPAAVFYGWFRLGVPTEPSALWGTLTDTLIATLLRAIAQNVIPPSSSANLKLISRRSERFKLDRLLQARPENSSTSLGDLLATLPVPLSLDHQRVIAGAAIDLRPEDPQLVKRIGDLAGFGGDAVAVARTLRIGALTGGHLPLARALQLQLQHDDESQGTLRPLAKLRPDEWLDLAYTHGTPEGPDIKPEAYASALAASVEQQHPTATLAARLKDGQLAQHSLLTDCGKFLGDNPDFNIVTANLNAIPEETNVGGVAQPEQLVKGLQTLQRMHSLGATWEETATLLDNDLYSPHQLLAAGPTQLGELLQGKVAPERIAALYSEAEELHNVTFAAFTAAFSPFSGPQVLPNQFGMVPEGDDPPPDGPVGKVSLKDVNKLLQSRGATSDPTRYKFPPPVRTQPIAGKNPEVHLGPSLDHQPTLQALFGAQDACACGHCSSVLSPAAYFVDVLQFIKNALPNNELLDRLLLRRPDLQDVELSCNNTNTEVPAIDLALEVLENSVALPFDVEVPLGSDAEAQLSGSTVGAAVRAALERTVRSLSGQVGATREGGYWTVIDAHRRWKITARNAAALMAGAQRWDTTGLDLSALIAALNQGHVGRGAEAAFARLFAPNHKQPPDLTNYTVTITPLVAGKSWRVEYQFAAELVTNQAPQLVLQTPAGVVWWNRPYKEATIAAIEGDLSRSTVPSLVQGLLASRFYTTPSFTASQSRADVWSIVSAKLELRLSFMPAQLTISSLAYQSGDAGADAVAWPENHNPEAYLRLRGADAVFPWSLPVDLPLEELRLFLDRALSSRRRLIELTTPVDQQVRESVSFALEVLDLSEAEAWFITQPPSDIYECWGLSAGQTMIWDAAAAGILRAESPLSLLQTLSILLQQSRLGFEELRDVLATAFVRGGGPPLVIVPQSACKPSEMKIPSLAIGHLDRIHRFVRLRRRLGWSAEDLDTAIQIASGAALNQTTLLYLVDLVRIGELLNLPMTTILAWYGTAASDAQKTRRLAVALGLTADELQHANQLFGIADVFAAPAETLRFCERVKDFARSGIAFEDLRYLLQHHETAGASSTLSMVQLRQLARVARDAVRSVPDPTERVPTLPATDPESIATALAIRLAREGAAIAALATGLDASPELVGDLLRTRLRHPSDVTKAAIDLFLEALFLTSDLAQPVNVAVESVLVRLYKTVFLWKALNLSASQLQVLRRSADDQNGLSALDFNTLPLATLLAPANVEGFEQLVALTRLCSVLPRAADLLHHYAALNFTDHATAENVQQLLAVGLKIESSEIQAAANQLHITSVNQYRDPRRLECLMELLTALKRLGASMEQVIPATVASPANPNGLASPSPNDRDATVARELLRNKYGESQWHDLIKPIADTLRERQRDALIDYLIARDARPRDGDANPSIFTGDRIRDANDLYERYLIDVQTGSCLRTTRLLQAIAAAQLFVQRVLLNLEQGISVGDDKRKLWDWMHSYRVWEANRKVFLFPENWLLPELRDDKTAIFSEMESALTQKEPSSEITAAALQGYLEDLDELAQISVIAMYEDRKQAGTTQQPEEERTLYVVGRTPNQPFRYFWRSCAKFGNAAAMSWNGWQALDIDNANDYLMPFIFDGDLHVAWPIFRKTMETTDESQPQPRWEVQIAWTRRTSQRWIKRQIGDRPLVLPRLLNKTELNSFTFRLRTVGTASSLRGLNTESVHLDCYSADPEVPDPARIDITRFPTNVKTHSGDPAFAWVNVYLTIQVNCFCHYTVEGDDRYEYLNDVDLTIEYNYGHWGGGPERKTFPAAGRSRVNGTSTISITVRNGDEVRATFSRRRSDGTTDTKTEVSGSLSDHNSEYASWVWNIRVVFEVPRSPGGSFDPNRTVVFKKAGHFLMDTLHDISAYQDTAAEQLPLLLPGANVAGNGFTLSTAMNLLPLPANRSTPIERSTTEDLTLVPAVGSDSQDVWYLHDGLSRYYLDLSGHAAQAWPDGQDFVRAYRRLRAAAKFNELFDPATQAMGRDGNPVATTTPPSTELRTTLASISFDRSTPYANYNWELFLHTPLAIADYLASQQRFDDARLWLHAVFDPTTEKKDDRTHQIPQFWRFLPFANDAQPEAIATLLTWFANPSVVDPEDTTEIESRLKTSIEEWKKNPFMPHLVARLRPSAYQWYTFFAYLNVLIGWGDQLFRRDTRESVNEATLLYVLAAKLLGPRPRTIPSPTPPPPQTYRSLQTSRLDEFSNAWLNYADLPGMKRLTKGSNQAKDFSPGSVNGKNGTSITLEPAPKTGHQILTSLSSLAFCIPQNEKLVEFYDRVEDRLFNVRHCRNIDGNFRDLPLYEPPIDPLLLIRARAAGLDIDTVIVAGLAPLPNYRFSFTLQKALELCAELKALGGALLAALEKQDSEELTLLRSRHEISLLKLVRDTRQKQLDEGEANIVALRQSEETLLERFGQYQKLLGKPGLTRGQDGELFVEQSSSLEVSTDATGEESGLGLTRKELNQLTLTAVANGFTQTANSLNVLGGILSLIPNIWAGDALVAGQTFGGSNLGIGMSAIAKAIEMGAAEASYHANQMSTFGSYERRQDEWVHQSKLALAELKQIQKQIIAAEIRKDIAERELRNHDTQIENAQEIEDFMRGKFTSQQLFRWMSSQIAEVYFRTYQLTLDQARRAERAYQYEVGLDNNTSPFVQAGHWDSLKRGLLAGEHLQHDLKRMESAYLERNVREFEITKNISLQQLDPFHLIALKETGTCEFDVPEMLFDLDNPGHYMRRIKMVSLSIPCIAGPYASVSATLQMKKNEIRAKPTPVSPYEKQPDRLLPAATEHDSRFVSTAATIKAIVTSNAQQDSGMFEPNMRDERYLPFEGAGVISSWKLELPNTFRPFNYSTISDVILHLRYTARDGGSLLKAQAIATVTEIATAAMAASAAGSALNRLFSLRHEFPTEWYRFLNQVDTIDGSQTLVFELTHDRFPFPFRDQTIHINRAEFFLKFKEISDSTTFTESGNIHHTALGAYMTSTHPLRLSVLAPPRLAGVATPPVFSFILNSDALSLNGTPHGVPDFGTVARTLGNWSLRIESASVEEIAQSLRYQVTANGASHWRLKPDLIEDIFMVCRYSV